MNSRTLLALLMAATWTRAASAGEAFDLDYSWVGVKACVAASTSPPFVLANVPKGTVSIHFVLTDSTGREYGGQTIAYRRSGNIAAGAVWSFGPCRPGRYIWTATAFGLSGTSLALASRERVFP